MQLFACIVSSKVDGIQDFWDSLMQTRGTIEPERSHLPINWHASCVSEKNATFRSLATCSKYPKRVAMGHLHGHRESGDVEYVCRFDPAGRVRREGSFIYQDPSGAKTFGVFEALESHWSGGWFGCSAIFGCMFWFRSAKSGLKPLNPWSNSLHRCRVVANS